MRRPVFPSEWRARRYTVSRPELTPEQRDEAQRAERILMESVPADLRPTAESITPRPDRQLLGETEFEVRDLVHEVGAKAIETAPDQRKKARVEEPV
jgi:hypothetical protein